MPSFVPDNFPLDGISGMTLPGLDGSSRSRDYARGLAVHDIDAPKVGFPCNLPIPAKLRNIKLTRIKKMKGTVISRQKRIDETNRLHKFP